MALKFKRIYSLNNKSSMETPKNPSEVKKMWEDHSAVEVVLFFGAALLMIAAANALGIWLAQKFSN